MATVILKGGNELMAEEYHSKSIDATLSRLETKIDEMGEDHKERRQEIKDILTRLMLLENFRYWLLGAVGAGSAGGGLIASKLFGG
tara:strand:+ start:268 stop:525 length:258 start_codon:yes stop_codon:yes gene_type:complete